ncbi:MAG TPA: sulfite exporter TauE/SafE family protein [Candidatus Baltobacteraceae bacterium]|nr:sulfite exporter TauE/SafE family protein [Candidatus Baltobacteraceae bacterium]
MMFIELVVAGLAIGTFIGVSGVGGGSLMTPMLILIMGVNPLVAVGTDLLYSVPTKIFGAILHARQRTLEWRVVRNLVYGGLPGVLAGIALLWVLRHSIDMQLLSVWVKRGVGIALIVSAISLVYSILKLRNAAQQAQPQPSLVEGATLPLSGGRERALIACGAVVGFFVALTSIGSGSITLPLLLLIAPFIGLRRLVGSDIAFAAFLIPIAAFGHIALKDVNYSVAGALLLGSLPGIYIGSRLCKKLPELWLRPAVAMVLVFAASRLV